MHTVNITFTNHALGMLGLYDVTHLQDQLDSSRITIIFLLHSTWSVLGPILFIIFVSPIALIASNHNVGQQQYTDDTQLHILLSLNSSSKIHDLENCLLSLHSWFAQNGLALNPDKSDAVLFGHVIPPNRSLSSHTSMSLVP